MFYKKKGLPEVGDIVLCTVKKILFHSVFVDIDDYENLEGMIHISEIAPGRIRNLRDFVREKKRIVCKVLRMDEKQHNIDLSLRRVGKSEMLHKITEDKQEEKSEKLLEFMGKNLKKDLKSMYDLIGLKAIENYGSLHNFFLDIVVKGESPLDQFNLDKKTKETLINIIKDKISTPEVTISGILTLKSTTPNGIEDIKKSILKVNDKKIKITYLGAPRYKVDVISTDFKSAEKHLNEATNLIIESIKSLNGEGAFEKVAN